MGHPFDARKVMLNDADLPTSQRRTVSLVTALRAAVAAVAAVTPGATSDDPKVGDLRGIARELSNRGVDGDSLVRYGFAPELIAGIVMRALPYWIPALRVSHEPAAIEPGDDSAAAAPTPSSGETWADLMGPLIRVEISIPGDTDLTLETLLPLLNRLADKVYPWVLAAPIDDLLTLRPPTVEQLNATSAGHPPDRTTMEEYRWISDRFAITYLRDWSTSSLRREYSWRAGQHPPPCQEALMSDRFVIDQDLNAEIARRSVAGEPPRRIGGPAGLGHALLSRLRSNAIEFLRLDRPREAAALFEFAVSGSPYDPELVNNLGFCLIPHDPRRALARLEEATRLGYRLTEINLHNRALCKLLLGDYQTALDMIGACWDQVHGESAVLWRPSSHGLRLQFDTSSREELAYLAHRAATFLGNDEAIEHWSHIAGLENGHD